MFTMWDRTYDAAGSAAPMFWDVATEDTSHRLKQPVTFDPNSPLFDHSSTQIYAVGALRTQLDHITARVRIRPYDYALLQDLVSSGDLDPAVMAQVPTYDVLGSMKTWMVATQNPVSGCNDDD